MFRQILTTADTESEAFNGTVNGVVLVSKDSWAQSDSVSLYVEVLSGVWRATGDVWSKTGAKVLVIPESINYKLICSGSGFEGYFKTAQFAVKS